MPERTVMVAEAAAEKSLAPLEQTLGHHFRDRDLLRRALTHRSCGKEQNERLEFLGDAVLGCILAEELYGRFAELGEGMLTRFKAHLEQGDTLVELAHEMELTAWLRVGGGLQGKTPSPGMLADVLEALLGAVLVDAGYAACRRVALNFFASRIEMLSPCEIPKDPKNLLQEYLQKRRLPLPEYSIAFAGDAPQEEAVRAQCHICLSEDDTEGHGATRRHAERQAARAMLHRLQGA